MECAQPFNMIIALGFHICVRCTGAKGNWNIRYGLGGFVNLRMGFICINMQGSLCGSVDDKKYSLGFFVLGHLVLESGQKKTVTSFLVMDDFHL